MYLCSLTCFKFKCKLPKWLKFFRKKRSKANQGSSVDESSMFCSIAESSTGTAEEVLGSSISQIHFSESLKDFGKFSPTEYHSADDASLVGLTSRTSLEYESAVSSHSNTTITSFETFHLWGPNVSLEMKNKSDEIRQTKSEMCVINGNETYYGSQGRSLSLPNLSLSQSRRKSFSAESLDDVIFLY